MFEAIIFVLILFVFIATFIFWCCEKKRELDTRIIGGAFITYCFISIFAQMYLLPILEINDWDKRISLQMQLTALVIGLTAAIIAFRNYQRKSGVLLSCMIQSIEWNQYGKFVHKVLIQNNKDRSVVIEWFNILVDNQIIELNIVRKDQQPFEKKDIVVIKAYESVELEFSSGPLFSRKENAYIFFEGEIFDNPKNKIKLVAHTISRDVYDFPLLTMYENINDKYSFENTITIDRGDKISKKKITLSCNSEGKIIRTIGEI